MPGFEIPDDGFLDVTIGGTKLQVDAYRAWNLVLDARQAVVDEDGPVHDFHARVARIVEDLGFPPPVSHRTADLFAGALKDAVDALKKNDPSGPTPGSPTTTGPEPSASAAG